MPSRLPASVADPLRITRQAPPGRRALGEVWAIWVVVLLPVVGVAAVSVGWPALRPSTEDLALLAGSFILSGLGVTVGFHRTFAHRALCPCRCLKVLLALVGSTALEGGVLGWAAVHRIHHRYSDAPSDPHSPVGRGGGVIGVLRGFRHAHLGWMLRPHPPGRAEDVPDLAADHDLRVIDRSFPLIVVATLLFPFAAGWVIHHTFAGALTTFAWAGLIRVGLTHHSTFSINSVCHLWGRAPFRSGDESRNVWWLAVPTFGESWHNNHHAFPRLARHGVDRHQPDLSALVIRAFERLGWVTDVHWPTPALLERKRRSPSPGSHSLGHNNDAT